MGSSTGVRHERSEQHSSPRVEGSTPVRGNFFADFFSLIQFWQIWQNDLFTENLEWVICTVVWLGNYEKMQMKGIKDTNYVDVLINYVNIALWLGNYKKVQMKGFIDTWLHTAIIDYNLWKPYHNSFFCPIRWIGPIRQGLLKKLEWIPPSCSHVHRKG